jgi:MATE family multidrug resistance protein
VLQQPLGGESRKAWRYKQLRTLLSRFFLLAILLWICFCISFYCFHQYLPALFVTWITWSCSKYWGGCSAPTVISGSYFSNFWWNPSCSFRCPSWSSRCKIPMYITFVAYWLVGFPVSIYLGMYTDLKAAIWIGLWQDYQRHAVFLYIRFNSLTKS